MVNWKSTDSIDRLIAAIIATSPGNKVIIINYLDLLTKGLINLFRLITMALLLCLDRVRLTTQ